MKDNNYQSVRRFIRKADMGMNQGDVHWGNRGVTWHRFNVGRFSRLPQGIMNSLIEQNRMFKSNYQQFAINPKTGKPYCDFEGMLFTIYAEDRAITDDIARQVPPELQAVSEFVRRTEIKMPPLSEKPEKSIGGPQWISHYAYAWKDQFPQGIVYDEARSAPRSVLQMTSETHKKYEHGPLVIRPTGQGFGLFIQTNQNNTVPIFIGQSAAGLTKYFEGGLAPNQSNVLMAEGPHGSVVPARVSKNVAPKNDFGGEQSKGNLHRFRIEQDGSIGADFEGRFVPFNESQIESIVPRLGSLWYIRPAKEVAGVTIDMGPWRMSDEVRNALSQPNVPNGFVAIKQLRQWLETVRPGLHTPAEGFKIITVGPIFSNAAPLPGGKTMGHSNFVTDLTRDSRELSPGMSQEVRRNIQWVVIGNEYSEARMQAIGQNTIRPASRVQGDAERSPSYENPTDAISYVKSKYLANSPNASQIINEMADSVIRADRVLRSAMNSSQTNPPVNPPVNPKYEEQAMQRQPINRLPEAKTIKPPMVDDPNTRSARMSDWLRKRISG